MANSTRLSHVFNASWERTTSAFWNKYPHPQLKHVKDCLVLERRLDENGILHSKRLICIEQEPPALLRRLSNNFTSNFAIETSTVDADRKIMRLETVNLTFRSFVEAKEVCEYRCLGDDSSQTQYNWSLTLTDTSNMPFLGNLVARTLMKRADQNADKGLRVMDNLSNLQPMFI